jgi:hypothetical protein
MRVHNEVAEEQMRRKENEKEKKNLLLNVSERERSDNNCKCS